MTLDQLKQELRLVSLTNDAHSNWTSKGSCVILAPKLPANSAKALLVVIERAERLSRSSGVIKGNAEGMIEDILAEFSNPE